MSKESIKQFLTCLAKDDYVSADKIFPKMVKEAAQKVINKRKPKILEEINKSSIDLAKSQIQNEG